MKIEFLFVLIIAGSFNQYVNAELFALGPPGLKEWWRNNPQYTHTSIAAFGNNPWGRKVFGNVELADPLNACSYIKQGDKAYSEHPIMVAQRGDCTFVMKAHYAQLAGAKMLLIADNQYEDVERRIMVAPGGGIGETIHIPVVLLSKQAGDKLIDSLKMDDEVVSKITLLYDFSLPKSDKITYHIWLTSSMTNTYEFIQKWEPYHRKLGNTVTMEPHYGHFHNLDPKWVTPANCVCGTKYCAPDPDDVNQNTGRDVLTEDLRHMCLYHELGPEYWWRYITQFDTFCLTNGNLQECAEHTLLSIGVDVTVINNCITNSYDHPNPDVCTKNKYFEKEFQTAQEELPYLYPSVMINKFMYRGNLIPPQGLFEAICESFTEMPQVCVNYFRGNALDDPSILDPIPVPIKKTHLSVILAAIIFLFMFGLFVCIFYRRYLRRELHKQMIRDVNVAVSQYIAFKDAEDKEEGSMIRE